MGTPQSRAKKRDDREFDTTQLKASGKGRVTARDYSAHFFRWSFIKRYMDDTKTILDIGCGQEKPLLDILRGGPMPRMQHYVGVDLNKVKPSISKNVVTYGEFNFVERWKELAPWAPFDRVVALEVIEHLNIKHGVEFLKGFRELLDPDGLGFISTPCYDGHRHAANHIHEYTVEELSTLLDKMNLAVVARYGTFMDTKYLKKIPTSALSLNEVGVVSAMKGLLHPYFDDDALSCFFAPLFPDHSRNNLWVLKRR
jgi:2-polyprenyl-3-methyl-5-hydroxy-6-metoxy-1,4-benzoquinol methylase